MSLQQIFFCRVGKMRPGGEMDLQLLFKLYVYLSWKTDCENCLIRFEEMTELIEKIHAF